MATPPVQTTGSPWQSAWGNASTPKLAPTASTFAASVGDLIVVESETETFNSGGIPGTPTNAAATSPAAITWTSRGSVAVSNLCDARAWTGVVTSAGNVQVSVAKSGTEDWGIIVWAFGSHNGVGQTIATSGTGAPSAIPASAWSGNSCVCVAIGDFAAGAIATRAYRTNIGAATEDNATNTDGNYTTYGWHHADSGAGGSVAVGMTAPTQTWSLVAVEVLGTAGGVVVTPRRSRNLVPLNRAANW